MITLKYGLKCTKNGIRNREAIWEYIYEYDWISNYSNGEYRDYIFCFVEHVSKYYSFND